MWCIQVYVSVYKGGSRGPGGSMPPPSSLAGCWRSDIPRSLHPSALSTELLKVSEGYPTSKTSHKKPSCVCVRAYDCVSLLIELCIRDSQSQHATHARIAHHAKLRGQYYPNDRRQARLWRLYRILPCMATAFIDFRFRLSLPLISPTHLASSPSIDSSHFCPSPLYCPRSEMSAAERSPLRDV